MSQFPTSLDKIEDGLPGINRAMLKQITGLRKQLTRSEHDALVALERTRIAANSVGVMQNDEGWEIIGESGIRRWFVATGGSDAANAAASHARTVEYSGGAGRVVLPGDSNTSTTSTGRLPPDSAGSNGDVKYDATVATAYLKTAGRWGVTGVFSIVPARTAPVRVATFGPSTATFHTPGFTDIQTTARVYPASGANTIIRDVSKFSLEIVYPLAYPVADGGITGQTTTDCLARDSAAYSTTRKATADILALGADVTLARSAAINNFLTVTSGTVAAAVATAVAEEQIILGRLLAGGGLVIEEAVFGYSGSGATDPVSTRAAIVLFNAAMQAYVATVSGNKLIYLDPVGLLCDSTGLFITGMSQDGTHLSQWGGYVLGLAEAKLLTLYFGKSSGARYKGTNAIVNSVMAVTATDGTGTFATGFVPGVTGGTRANGKVENIDGVQYQTMEVTSTSTNCAASINLPIDFASAGTVSPVTIVAGDIYGIEFDAFVQDLATGGAPPNLLTMQARVDITKTGQGRVVWDGATPTVAMPLLAAYKGRFVFGPLVMSEPTANLGLTVVKFSYSTDVNGGTFKMGTSAPRLVKLGAPVLTS